jgi:hypothetical protein
LVLLGGADKRAVGVRVGGEGDGTSLTGIVIGGAEGTGDGATVLVWAADGALL